jgi:hypothetical protein
MNISQSGIEITKRFFKAINTLKKQGIIGGLQTFTKNFEINRWNMVTVKNNTDNNNCNYNFNRYKAISERKN